MEYGRNEKYKFCDSQYCMVIDKVTGKPERPRGNNAVMTLGEAMTVLAEKTGWEERTVVVKLDCVSGFRLDDK